MHGNYQNRQNHPKDFAVSVPDAAPIESVAEEMPVAAGSELMIDHENSANGFYKVCNAAGIESHCMKQYVNLKA